LHLYWTVILFVVFVFLFQDFIAGFDLFPIPPVPPLNPLIFSRLAEPRDIG